MNKFFNYCMALLLPSMVSCNGGKVKEVPEDMYGCPMPDVVIEENPEEIDLPVPDTEE